MNTYAYERITERIIALLTQGTAPMHGLTTGGAS